MDAKKARSSVQVDLSEAELQLVRTALKVLRDTLGREESDELEEVQQLLDRLPKSDPRT